MKKQVTGRVIIIKSILLGAMKLSIAHFTIPTVALYNRFEAMKYQRKFLGFSFIYIFMCS